MGAVELTPEQNKLVGFTLLGCIIVFAGDLAIAGLLFNNLTLFLTVFIGGLAVPLTIGRILTWRSDPGYDRNSAGPRGFFWTSLVIGVLLLIYRFEGSLFSTGW